MHDRLASSPEAVYIAIKIAERFIALGMKEAFLLKHIAVAALRIAHKFVHRGTIKLDEFIQGLGEFCYSSTIRNLEIGILKFIHWELPPTNSFVILQ